jgi:acyl-coenzyme A thioesterase PaaI-like protein
MSAPPPGFELLCTTSPFVGRAGIFYLRKDSDESQTVGTFISDAQSNSEGSAHGGFLLCFADYAITIVTTSITLSMTVDFLRPVKVGLWIEARIIVRKASAKLIFADTVITGGGGELLRASGLFRPFEKRQGPGGQGPSDPGGR